MSAWPSLRLFFGVEAPLPIRAAVGAVVGSLRPILPEARWVRPEAVHLTVRFLGATPREKVDAIIRAAAPVAAAASPFGMTTGGPGTFGASGRPRVLWTALEGNPSAAGALVASLEKALASVGFSPEKRAYHAHLTLARFDPRRRALLTPALLETARAGLAGLAYPASELVLFESRTSPGGVVYTPIRRFPLGQGSALAAQTGGNDAGSVP